MGLVRDLRIQYTNQSMSTLVRILNGVTDRLRLAVNENFESSYPDLMGVMAQDGTHDLWVVGSDIELIDWIVIAQGVTTSPSVSLLVNGVVVDTQVITTTTTNEFELSNPIEVDRGSRIGIQTSNQTANENILVAVSSRRLTNGRG